MGLAAPPSVETPLCDIDSVITDAVIREAKRRARRRRRRYGGLTAAALAVAAFAVWGPPPGGTPPPAEPPSPEPVLSIGAAASVGDLGVFAPYRGWIFFADGRGISAIDPADPSSRRVVLEDPEGISSHVMPVGWSADGTKLALIDEGESGLWVMDSSGSLTHVRAADGCCLFVRSNLLSPDGTTAIPYEESRGWPVWSPDGTMSVLTTPAPHDRSGVLPATAEVTDHERGTTWRLDLPPLEIGHMAWSPDSERLVLTAPGPRPYYWVASNSAEIRGLYVVRADGSSANRISSWSYLAAAWSPDGTQIAALTTGRELWVMNADGSDPRMILGRAVLPPEWTGIAWQPTNSHP